jgi:hypothetical protein
MQGAERFVCPLLTIEDDASLFYFEEDGFRFESRKPSFEWRFC